MAALLAAVIGWFVIPRAMSPWVNVEYAKDSDRPAQDQAEIIAAGDAMGLGLAAADLAGRDRDLSDRDLLLRVAERWAGQVQGLDEITMIRAVVTPDGRLALPSVPPVVGAGDAARVPGRHGGEAPSGSFHRPSASCTMSGNPTTPWSRMHPESRW
ncbi:hypothetical protein Acor_15540 [Acrocarpospora corrugata]|uniref:Uncharacterized protein n=1 Tax=Acrocarpospora corrugata TaxID=35763 RepID=A0A5M3VXG8_9ACTN|nr:hypothetical protein Acor_15540 [Acrocarpospora corrugata]